MSGVDPPQFETKPWFTGPLTSITSRTVRPKVGWPQMSTLSFVWNGP